VKSERATEGRGLRRELLESKETFVPASDKWLGAKVSI